jgi:hypothetical protein
MQQAESIHTVGLGATINDVARSITWIPRPAVSALYASAGTDLRPITLTHPEILKRKSGKPIEAPSFFVYIDKNPFEIANLSFDDERTRITTTSCRSLTLHGFEAQLLRLRFESIELGLRDVAVLRVQATNDAFTDAALAEGWRPHLFIGMNDGCGGFGGNDRCENQLLDAAQSIPARLRAPWWITDHLPGSTARGGDDPENGEIVQSSDPRYPIVLRQVAFLCTSWRSNVNETLRLYGGARLFETQPSYRHLSTPAETMHRGVVRSPKANQRLA